MDSIYLTAEQKAFITSHAHEDVHDLALRYSAEDMPFLLAQIRGRQMAAFKIPSWFAIPEIIYPAHLALEQASSEITARYKVEVISQCNKGVLLDATGGLGVDFSFMARHFHKALYIEQNADLCTLAEHNFKELSLENVSIMHRDSERFLREMDQHVDVLYLDPSRRDYIGKRVFCIEDCTPNVMELLPNILQKADSVLIKYSPMLDISFAANRLQNVSQVHVVSVENECKELLFLLQKEPNGCTCFAVDYKRNSARDVDVFTLEEEQTALIEYASKPIRYLYEPNSSLLKAGAFKFVAKKYDVAKLHQHSHLYTSNKFIPHFPGRVFEVKQFFPPSKENLRAFLAKTKKANISVRNFPMSVAEIRKKTNLKEGGEEYLFATTMSDGQKLWIVCKKIIF